MRCRSRGLAGARLDWSRTVDGLHGAEDGDHEIQTHGVHHAGIYEAEAEVLAAHDAMMQRVHKALFADERKAPILALLEEEDLSADELRELARANNHTEKDDPSDQRPDLIEIEASGRDPKLAIDRLGDDEGESSQANLLRDFHQRHEECPSHRVDHEAGRRQDE